MPANLYLVSSSWRKQTMPTLERPWASIRHFHGQCWIHLYQGLVQSWVFHEGMWAVWRGNVVGRRVHSNQQEDICGCHTRGQLKFLKLTRSRLSKQDQPHARIMWHSSKAWSTSWGCLGHGGTGSRCLLAAFKVNICYHDFIQLSSNLNIPKSATGISSPEHLWYKSAMPRHYEPWHVEGRPLPPRNSMALSTNSYR